MSWLGTHVSSGARLFTLRQRDTLGTLLSLHSYGVRNRLGMWETSDREPQRLAGCHESMNICCRTDQPGPPWRAVLLGVALAALAGCGTVGSLREALAPPTPHEQYSESLRSAGLLETALGRDWLLASERALTGAPLIELPFRESGYFAPDAASAAGYRFALRRGQRLVVELETEAAEPFRVFVDLFEQHERPGETGSARPESGEPEFRRVTSAEDRESRLEIEADRDRIYALRLQPELLRGGRYTITARQTASLAFPVVGRDSRAVQSAFGAPRDGGRREHHGIDIFAPRGTPVLAAADGFVTRVGTTQVGGRVVWVSDLQRGQSLYYAHLDTQLVSAGTRVRTGDTLGLVGNSGNAARTAPHLHFGIYRRGWGAVDPYPFVHEPRQQPPAIGASTAVFGDWVRIGRRDVRLRAAPGEWAPLIAVLALHTAARVVAASSGWYGVRLPDGTTGYVLARTVESADRPVRRERVMTSRPVHDLPVPGAAVMDSVAAGGAVPVLGSFAGYLLVEAPNGRTGWISGD